MKFPRTVRQIAESLLVCLGFCVIPFLPRKWVLGLSIWLGNRAFRVCGKLRKTAMANLDIAFGPELSQEDKERVCKGSFRTFSLVLLDIFWFGVLSGRRIPSYVRFDSSFEFYFNTRPAVVTSAHLGNWEIMGQAVALRGHPCTSVAAPLANPFVDRVLNRLRRVTGQGVAERGGAIRTLMKALRRGGRTALLVDQNILPADGGEFVDFFGLPVPVSKAPAALSARTGAGIVFIFCVGNGAGHYTAYALPPFNVGRETGLKSGATQKLAGMIESVVRKHPDQWLWMYKRWKYVPRGALLKKYPFYAKKAG